MYKINLSKLKVLIELQAFFPVIIFLVIISAFSDSIPYLDGNIQFLMVHDFYKGGFENLFINWNSIHPPFKQLLVSLFFFVFGKNSLSYSFGGLVVGIIGILYLDVRNQINRVRRGEDGVSGKQYIFITPSVECFGHCPQEAPTIKPYLLEGHNLIITG